MKIFKFIFGTVILLLIFSMVILPQSRQIIAKETITDIINPSEKINEVLDWFRDVYLKQQDKLEEAITKLKNRTIGKTDKAKRKEIKTIVSKKELVNLNKLTWEYTNVGIPNALIKIETVFLKQEEKIAKLEYLLIKEKAGKSKKNMSKEIKEKKKAYKEAKKKYREFLKKARQID
ncbi:hypothetical protein KAI68_04490 [bacterium]|nr:hypothetical protein [bacterium]